MWSFKAILTREDRHNFPRDFGSCKKIKCLLMKTLRFKMKLTHLNKDRFEIWNHSHLNLYNSTRLNDFKDQMWMIRLF